jgi:tRNA pseudouridine38-40 synthase
MRTLKLTLAYDGTNYAGWQRQANGMSVQQVLEEAFAPLMPAGVQTPSIAGASRTDAGVHALGQVASLHTTIDIPATAIQRALNARLPADVRVIGAIDATPGFHARANAAGKSYRYRVVTTPVRSPFDRWFVHHAPGARDVEAMRRAAARLDGRHDFAAFQAAGSAVRHTTRTMQRVEVREAGGEIVFEVDGDGFLRHMVRAMVGTLLDVGAGLRTPESIDAVVASRNRREAGPTAPAEGLVLISVRY